MHANRDHIAALKRKIARLESGFRGAGTARGRFTLGVPAVDAALDGGLARASVHEVFAAQGADAGAAVGFAAGLAVRAAGDGALLWARDAASARETGALSAHGVLAWGLSPERLILVNARDAAGVLRAGEEAARSTAVSASVIEIWGAPRVLDLTASRRLALAARASGGTLVMLHAGADPRASAAETRWAVRAAASTPLEANAPGRPAFDITLLRQRAGNPGRTWRLEWDRDACTFSAPATLSRPMAGVPADRSAGAPRTGYERAG